MDYINKLIIYLSNTVERQN